MISKFCLAGTLCASIAIAQSAATPNVAPVAKPLAFEVVSIRQNVSGGKVVAFGATPDGFRMVNMSLTKVILTAYVPTTGEAVYWEPVGFPEWLSQNRYDIEARVAGADRAQWHKPESQSVMLRAMLQTMLAERCGLVVHRERKDASVYSLEVAKGGPKFAESKADEAPRLSPFPGGGAVVPEAGSMHFYQAPMTLLASLLTNRNLGGPEIQDKTGLTGRYDFVVEWGAWTGGVGATAGDAADPGPTLFSAVAALGLKLVPARGQVETLVLDHVERPSGN
jgi:bla regulator protein BlaR1